MIPYMNDGRRRMASFPARPWSLAGALAILLFPAGCQESWHYWVLPDVDVSLPEITGRERLRERAGAPAEPLPVTPGGGRTILVASQIRENPKVTDEDRARTFVVVLDGPPAKGTYEVSPANGRLIQHSVYLPARKPYGGLEGRVKIVAVFKNGEVLADCVLRNTVLNVMLERSFVVRGLYSFKPVDAGDPLLQQAGIRLGAPQSQPGS